MEKDLSKSRFQKFANLETKPTRERKTVNRFGRELLTFTDGKMSLRLTKSAGKEKSKTIFLIINK